MIKNVWEILNKNYVNTGLKIFPVTPNGKTPLIREWQKECSANFMQLLYWIENTKECNWALPATPNNLFVIDLDVHDPEKNGIENFKKLMDKIGLKSIDTLQQETPSGGRHLIFRSDDELKQVPNTSNSFKDYPGIDIRTDGYIVVEPSMINDKQYKLFGMESPQPMPKELKKFILENVGTKEEKNKSQYTKPTEVYVGNRDTALFEYINNLYYKTRLDYDEILTLAKRFNEEVLEKPFAERTVVYKVKKAFEKDRSCCMYLWLGDKDEEVKDN